MVWLNMSRNTSSGLSKSQNVFSCFVICFGASSHPGSFRVCHLDMVISYFDTGIYEFYACHMQFGACRYKPTCFMFHVYCFRGCDNDVINSDQHTSLHLAIKNGHLTVVKLLYRWNANQNKDSEGNAPIVLAARRGFPEIVEFLASATGQKDKDR